MPIDPAQWNRGSVEEPLKERILRFLAEGKPQAFTEDEIRVGLGLPVPEYRNGDLSSIIGVVSAYFPTTMALVSLINDGKVESKRVKDPSGSHTYYRAR